MFEESYLCRITHLDPPPPPSPIAYIWLKVHGITMQLFFLFDLFCFVLFLFWGGGWQGGGASRLT